MFLFQQMIADLENNLLTVDSGLTHDGSAPSADEEMSPTTRVDRLRGDTCPYVCPQIGLN